MRGFSILNSSEGPTFKRLLGRPIDLLAFGFGSGLSPKAPGTVGTLAAIPLYLMMAQLTLPVYLLLLVISGLVGVYICGRTAADLGVHDHPGIVWDEFVGFWITMFAAPAGLLWVLVGFLWFRLFDIMKPWPVSWCDKRVGGGLGIMLDDIVAGLMALAAMQLCYWAFL